VEVGESGHALLPATRGKLIVTSTSAGPRATSGGASWVPDSVGTRRRDQPLQDQRLKAEIRTEARPVLAVRGQARADAHGAESSASADMASPHTTHIEFDACRARALPVSWHGRTPNTPAPSKRAFPVWVLNSTQRTIRRGWAPERDAVSFNQRVVSSTGTPWAGMIHAGHVNQTSAGCVVRRTDLSRSEITPQDGRRFGDRASGDVALAMVGAKREPGAMVDVDGANSGS